MEIKISLMLTIQTQMRFLFLSAEWEFQSITDVYVDTLQTEARFWLASTGLFNACQYIHIANLLCIISLISLLFHDMEL